jgi:hypothetical protein
MTFTLAQAASRIATGLRGGATYAVALATGDMAPDAVVEARRAICRECPSRVRALGNDWCGEPLTETATECGCNLYAKTAVGSERCPQGKWEEP